MFENKVILITGGSGSWGNELTKQLLEKNPKKIIIFSRGELAQVNMERKFKCDKLHFVIGDVRDFDAVNRVCKGVDYVFHLAALKHVPVCENQPQEAIKTNINGTTNLINACIKNNVKKFIDVSTDKACLDYHQTVTLFDGTKQKISDIVNNKKELIVKSWDGEKYVGKKITNWYKNKLSERQLFRIKYIDAPYYGKNQSSILVTEDHPILTVDGWINAIELNDNDKVYTDEVLLNKKQRSFVLGTLLGDASLVKRKKTYNRAYLKISHCLEQKEWIELKHKILYDISNGINQYKNKKRNTQDSLVLNTNSNIYLSELYDKCYDNGIKKIPRETVVEYLDDETIGIFLSTLYMDDGYITDDLIRISTHNFSKNDVEWLANELTNRGYTSYVYGCDIGYNTYPELRFRKDGSVKFINLISKFLPNSMRYKLPVNQINDYDRNAWNVGITKYMKSSIKIEKYNKPYKKSVYCIDVEDTHNFVSKGFVVHNCSPSNLYGMTKSVGEKLTIQANKLTDKTDFVCIRGGNVLGSNGSVVPFFIKQIKEKDEITITDNRMTRYFLTLEEAIKLLFQASEYSVGGETYVMNMPSFYIKDLAKVLIDYYGFPSTNIREIGMREGEKIHELLISEQESKSTYKYNEDYYVILPEINTGRDYSHINKNNKVDFITFASSDNLKDNNYLYKLLDNGGFLKKPE